MKIHFPRQALCLGAAIAGLMLAPCASAATVKLSNFSASAPPATASIGVQVLDVAMGKAVGAYDITLQYDAAIWSAVSVDFSQFLSGPDQLGSMAAADLSVTGLVRLQEVSFITPIDPQPLDVLQPQSFTLATVNFNAVGSGIGSFGIGQAALYDELGDSMAVATVPEPATAALALLGLAGLAAQARRTRNGAASTRR